MIHEAIDTAFTVARALAVWIVVGGMALSLLLLGIAACIAWAWHAPRKRPRRPLWARGRLKARILARARVRGSQAPQEPSEPPDFEEAA